MRANRYQTHMIPLQTMVDEAIEFIREHEPPEGYLLADSYGKDSTVLLVLARMSGVKFMHVHNFTGVDPPELTKFGQLHHPEATIIRPKMTMWEGIHKWYPPTINQRWCCRVLKHDGRPGFPKTVLVGIRAEESSRRAKRGKAPGKTRNGVIHVKPIFGWTLWHVWEFIEGLNLPYCELYDQGFDRIG
jgi:phosphoadenosine phosphosulfate reductase